MDFLLGIAKAGRIDFFRLGNGRPDTDYQAKGEKVVALLEAGYSFVICHVNAPDEASHLGNRELKIRCLEAFDRDVVGPALRYLREQPDDLGGLMIVPDHYTNHAPEVGRARRAAAHSLDPVPFCLWNGRDRDGVTAFSEAQAFQGACGATPRSHLETLDLLGVRDHGWRAAAASRGIGG
jgi:2,3-bisphosphoglycerate-independent phosphoglycerate mutase